MLRRLFAKKSRDIRLGRWSRQHQARKAELANYDHCGTCGTPKKRVESFDNSMEISLCALQSMHAYPKRN
ncbi:MAG: hypothetical protein CL967_05615 [Euryarchaeota archaeon]|nr:hypothetical protein [Euryarchaeota archaeon]